MRCCREDSPALFLPVQAVGASDEHRAFRGTLTLSPETALRAFIEIGESVHRAGIRKLVIINSHGGNIALIDLAARQLRVRHTMLAVHASWGRFGYPDGPVPAMPSARTASMAATSRPRSCSRPIRDLVRREKIADFSPTTYAMERDYTHLRADFPAGFGWMTQDLHASGAVGDASLATAEKGEAALDHGARAFMALLRRRGKIRPAGSRRRSARLTHARMPATRQCRGDMAVSDAGETAAETKREDKRLNNLVAVTVVILTVFMAITKIKDDNINQAMQKAKADSVDAWAEYQFARVKLHVDENGLNQLRLLETAGQIDKELAAKQAAEYEADIKKYEGRSKETRAKAERLEAEYDRLNFRDDQFDMSDVFLSIAVAVSAVAALVDSFALLYFAWASGALGHVLRDRRALRA